MTALQRSWCVICHVTCCVMMAWLQEAFEIGALHDTVQLIGGHGAAPAPFNPRKTITNLANCDSVGWVGHATSTKKCTNKCNLTLICARCGCYSVTASTPGWEEPIVELVVGSGSGCVCVGSGGVGRRGGERGEGRVEGKGEGGLSTKCD